MTEHDPACIRVLGVGAIAGGALIVAAICINEIAPEGSFGGLFLAGVGIAILAFGLMGWAYYAHERATTTRLRAEIVAGEQTAKGWYNRYIEALEGHGSE